MSLFKNRIPKNSVSFSHETYELQFPEEIILSEENMEEVTKISAAKEELLAQQEQLQLQMLKVRHMEKELEKEKIRLQQEREQFSLLQEEHRKQVEADRKALFEEQKEMAVEWSELLWDQSLQLAQKIVNQAIDMRQMELLPILKGIVQTLPTSFEKLIITVHPETFEQIEQEKVTAKEYWLLELVEWKYDFSLQFGEFILEEEKEFFEFKFSPIFEKLRQQWEEKQLFEGQKV
ncbi:FliH/SctL family protein [Bacillus sp. BP-3]|uniref:FliH/SctL family protein n=1 Tax=Bacillus sp. BP-3 TaxID=3022773 RepID=UPI00232B3CAB|nr:FliH/SctL family protein [Bacillus sp. BP-3]MDC2865757.1 FliH/SctL family protein [Bacillus sp. BP-3]